MEKIDLTITCDPEAAYGKGGSYLSWTKINEKNIFYKVLQQKKDGNWEQISTYSKGKTVKVLNVYPS